jgi:hypothetical protein
MTDAGTIDELSPTSYLSTLNISSRRPAEDHRSRQRRKCPWKRIRWFTVDLFALIVRTDENNKQQYFVAFALREFIQCSFKRSGGDGIVASLPVIVPPLQRHAADEEEVLHGCRVLGIADLSTVVTILTGLEASRLVFNYCPWRPLSR